jgi:hypothetical protein
LEYAWDEYSSVVQQYVVNKYEVCNKITKKLIETFKKKIQYGNNIPKYSKMLLPMLLYMVNHQLYIIGKGYPNKWSYDKNKEFEKIIDLQISSPLPLLNIKFTDTEFSNFEVPNAFAEKLKTQINDSNTEIKSLENRQENLTKELNDITNKKNKSEYDLLRINELHFMIQKDIERLSFMKTNLSAYINKLQSINNAKFDPLKNLKIFIDGNKKKLESIGSVNKIYDSVFVDVLNSDFKLQLKKNIYQYQVDTKTYPLLWRKYFSSAEKNDYTQIIDRMGDHQKRIINDTTLTLQEKIKSFRMITGYFSDVILPFSKNYFELPKEYNGANYSLTIILDIITHIIKRVVLVNLMDTIIKSLTKYVLSIFPKINKSNVYKTDKEYQLYILDLLIQIIDDKGDSNGSRLLKYIFDILPLKLVKVILQIYEGFNEGENDIDRGDTVESLFDNINKIIGSNVALDISDDSSLLTNLKDYVYPFYGDYIELFVKEMKNVVDNYLRLLQHQSSELELLEMLSWKIQ